MDLVKEVKHAGKTVKVFYDPDPINPQKDYDNLTTIAHWHRRYDLGLKLPEQCTADEIITVGKDNGDPVLAILPLYLYEHSGISISTGPFSCSFDSCQVGWAFVLQSQSKLMGCEDYNREQYEEAIRGDIETYDNYLTGQVFGYQVVGRDGEVLDSCWGYIGDSEYCLSEGKLACEYCEDPAVVRDAEELASRATYAGPM